MNKIKKMVLLAMFASSVQSFSMFSGLRQRVVRVLAGLRCFSVTTKASASCDVALKGYACYCDAATVITEKAEELGVAKELDIEGA